MAESFQSSKRIGIAELRLKDNGSLEFGYKSALARDSELTGESCMYGCYRLHFLRCRSEGTEKKEYICLVMATSKLLHKMHVLLAVATLCVSGSIRAQVLPVLNSFSGRTFEGTVDVSWPVLFDGCTFRTDGVVLNHSYGAVFRNCTFECPGGELFIAGSGDGIILADCEVKGCESFSICKEYSPAHRNYITGVLVNGEECSVLDEQSNIVDIDGLELAESARGVSDGPVIMLMSCDRKVIERGDSAYFRLRGLDDGMFVGWQCSVDGLRMTVDKDGLGCMVYADNVKKECVAVISAYTEYGLEAAFGITLVPQSIK